MAVKIPGFGENTPFEWKEMSAGAVLSARASEVFGIAERDHVAATGSARENLLNILVDENVLPPEKRPAPPPAAPPQLPPT